MNVLEERAFYKTRWLIRRFADDAAFARGEAGEVVGGDGQKLPAESVIDGNILLSEGIGELWDLVCGLGSPIAFSNANAYIGVGDSTTAEWQRILICRRLRTRPTRCRAPRTRSAAARR